MSNKKVLKIIDRYIANADELIRKQIAWETRITNPIISSSESNLRKINIVVAIKLTLEGLRAELVKDA